ncbi:MAG: guanylate kinase [Candidatus Omnitrophica bacterium]|nr:guanylate kinase [Candidatus Omnitrophota bacterium]
MAKNHGRLFVISAPSGAGKTTLVNKVLKLCPNIVRSVSMTTRQIRKGEAAGRDYLYVSKEKFESLIKVNGFLEYAQVFGNYYGSPRKFIEAQLRQKKDVILTIDVQGAMKIQKSMANKAVFIFILPPKFSDLKKRLLKRKSDSSKEIANRLRIAKQEMKYLKYYDYQIINDDIKIAYQQLLSIFISTKCKILK